MEVRRQVIIAVHPDRNAEEDRDGGHGEERAPFGSALVDRWSLSGTRQREARAAALPSALAARPSDATSCGFLFPNLFPINRGVQPFSASGLPTTNDVHPSSMDHSPLAIRHLPGSI